MIAILCAVLSVSPYHIDPLPHAVLTGGMMSTVVLLEAAVKPSLDPRPTCLPDALSFSCERESLTALDRSSVREGSRPWRVASNALLISGLAAPFVLDALDARDSSALIDSLVMAEATATALFTTELLKYAVRRPRPSRYVTWSMGQVGSADDNLSFPSGHVGVVGAMSTSYAYTFWLRHPDSAWRWVVVGTGAALTGVTAAARIEGGKHFVSDVLAGVAIGAASGILIPWLAAHEAAIVIADDSVTVRKAF